MSKKNNFPQDNFEPLSFVDPVNDWTVGFIYSTTKLFSPTVKWLNHNISLSIKPGETWPDAYLRQLGKQPETRMVCFKSTL